MGVEVVVDGSAVVVVTADFGAIVGSVIAGTAKADVNTIMMSNAIVVLTECRVSNISVEHLKYNRGHVVFNLWYYSSKPASRKLCMPKNDLSIGQFNVAHYTNGNVLTIKKMLRHKSVQNTMKYIRALEFRDEDFEMATATTEEEVKQLGQTGFVKYDEMKGTFLQKTQKV